MAEAPGTVLIVGGGVFGLTAAISLRERGWSVVVADAASVPNVRSASASGPRLMRMDYGADDARTALAAEALAGWDRWDAAWGGGVVRADGLLVLAASEPQPGSFAYESLLRLQARGVDVEWLDRGMLAAVHPAWRGPNVAGGFFDPTARWADGAAVMERLLEHAKAVGVDVRPLCGARQLLESDGRVVGARMCTGDVHADAVVVAGGAATRRLVPSLASALEPLPVLTLEIAPPDGARWRPPDFPPWLLPGVGTGYPPGAAGTLSVEVQATVDAEVEPAELARAAHARLLGWLPDLAQASIVSSHVCVGTGRWGDDPWIDRDPEREGLWIASGGGTDAFKLAPVLGHLVADAVEERFDPRRMRFRARGGSSSPSSHA
jgi:sarcosine oxidase/L-pipecolate oxidase